VHPQAWVLIAFAVAGLALILAGLGALALEGRKLQLRVTALREKPPAVDLVRMSDDLARLSGSLERLVALSVRAAVAIGRIRAQFALLNRFVRGFPGPT
jgi:hypothetical protein